MEKKSNRHAFFKFFSPGSSSKQLEIPSAFTLSMQGVLPEKVVLQDSYNNSWQLNVVKLQDMLYFRDGWANFVEDNSIEGGDVIFFEYFGDGLFETKIYDATACEKKRVGARKARIQQKKVVNQEEVAAKNDEEALEIEREDEAGKGKENGASDDNHEFECGEMGDEQVEEIPTNDHALDAEEGASYGVVKKATRIRRVSDRYSGEIFESELTPIPANPYFVTKINTKRKRELKIPSAFTLSIQGALPEKVFLLDSYNNSWQVKVGNVRDMLHLRDGWTNFVDDNIIERGDVIFFEYFGNGLFKTKIHDSTARGRKRVGAPKARKQQKKVVNQKEGAPRNNEEEHEVKMEDEEGKGEEYGASDDNCEFACEMGDEQEGKKRVGAPKARKQQKKVVNRKEGAPRNDEEEHEVKREDEEGKGEEYGASDDNCEFACEMGDEQEEGCIPTNDHSPDVKEETSSDGVIEKATRTRRVSDIYGREIFRSGLMPVPANPYFVTRINTKRKGELYIPKDVVRDNTLDLPEEIFLFDPYGRKWTGKGKIWKDGRRYYTIGWRKLCQRNFIEEEDICICEFVERDQRLTIDVSFIRASEEFTYS